ncbi:50S ribosomal protein L32 [Candidatus Gottesmanbacteria bacterium RIFCSPHIGHO2_12_FULL_40_13]|nr:MAG: 50S ribosomal protein L32 [Candidatus Gottesmanbacteria bacterium RIFCSPHIGHO2_12_FULL_40_13]
MAPLPKRRHSSARSGKREKTALIAKLPGIGLCRKCAHPKKSHRACPKCGFYK